MIRILFLEMILITTVILGWYGQDKALACNKTAGCTMDSVYDDYKMKRDGRMDKAMAEGRANVEDFRAHRAAEQSYGVRR